MVTAQAGRPVNALQVRIPAFAELVDTFAKEVIGQINVRSMVPNLNRLGVPDPAVRFSLLFFHKHPELSRNFLMIIKHLKSKK